MIRVPSTPRCSPIGSWAVLVKLGYIVRWQKTLFLLNTSTPLQATSNGWRMTWSGLWGMRKLTWRLVRKQEGLKDHLEGPYNLLFYTFMILMFVFEFNKGLECSKSPMKTNILSFNLSNERISLFYYLCLLSYHLFIFLFFSFSFAMEFLPMMSFEEFSPCPWSFLLTFA